MYKNINRKIEKYQGWEKGIGAIPYVLDRLIIDCSREDKVIKIEEFYNSHTYLWLLEFDTFAPLIKDILEIYEYEKKGKFIEKICSFYYDYLNFEEIEKKELKKINCNLEELLSKIILKIVGNSDNSYIDILPFLDKY